MGIHGGTAHYMLGVLFLLKGMVHMMGGGGGGYILGWIVVYNGDNSWNEFEVLWT